MLDDLYESYTVEYTFNFVDYLTGLMRAQIIFSAKKKSKVMQVQRLIQHCLK
jgi:hypothetical protein